MLYDHVLLEVNIPDFVALIADPGSKRYFPMTARLVFLLRAKAELSRPIGSITMTFVDSPMLANSVAYIQCP